MKGCKVATDTEPRHRNLCVGLALDHLLPVESSHDVPEKSSSPAHRCYRAHQKRVWATLSQAGGALSSLGLEHL